MSGSVRPERAAFQELETLVRHLSDELAAFRKRALTAEARLRDVEAPEATDSADAELLLARVEELERTNAALNARLERATARATQMLERVRFLRQQAHAAGDR